MNKRTSPLEIYKLLDKSNCRECGKESCLEFATQLLDRKISVEECSHLLQKSQVNNFIQIKQKLMPPQKQISFGPSSHPCIIGGEEVLNRHERTYYNQTAIAVELHDNFLDLQSYKTTLIYLRDLTITRIAEDLKIDSLAIRYVSQNPEKYLQAIKLAAEITLLPLIICCLDAKVIRQVLDQIQDQNPLIYAASPENINEFSIIAKKYDCPMVCYAPSLSQLYDMILSLQKMGVSKLVLDPGTFFSSQTKALTFNSIQQIRTNIFINHISEFGYPLLGVPAALWAQKISLDLSVITKIAPAVIDPETHQEIDPALWRKQYEEILMGIVLETIDTNLIITHTGQKPSEIWGLLALMTFRQNIFTDPRIYPRVDPELVLINDPDEWSPVYITSNYRMTKIPVEQDLIDANLQGYLVVVDTEGIGIESATAGGQFNEERIKKTLDEFHVFEKIKHRIVIIPGMAARLKEPLQEISQCDVWVGPRDSSAIPKYLESKWNIKSIQKQYSS